MVDALVVGLGNPGSRYAGTRHNVGADTVVALVERCGDRLRTDKQVSAEVARVRMDAHSVVLAVPTTFMNDSGRSLSQLVRRHRPGEMSEVVVVHDELDLEPGVVKVKRGGGLAGHNGLRSIEAHLHTRDFTRVRIGVGKPPGGAERGADWVLSKVSGTTREVLEESVNRAADAVERIVSEGVDAAMAEFNARR
ncbi:MAG: aminoacyl-tRNA hydrolase [Microthrixaceae bacterium]|nr:aminoacyl-tRNA hydrolase [Microthrixaceae bacterium]